MPLIIYLASTLRLRRFHHSPLTFTQGCVPIYGVFDFTDHHGQWTAWDRHHGKRHADATKPAMLISFLQKFIVKRRFDEERGVYADASPAHHARAGRGRGVPFLVVHGDRDILVPCRESE